MKKLTLFVVFSLFLLPFAVMGQCGSNALKATDADGNSYASLKVGPHCWTQFNLKTKAEGSFIYKSDMYPDTTANLGIYGRLYNWYAAMNIQPGQSPVVGEHGFVQGICPEGWHLPNEVEVTQLMTNTTPTLHDVQYWLVPGTNTTTYTMRPGGFYNAVKGYGENLCGNSFMWTAQSLDESNPSIAWSDCHCDYILVDKATAHDGMSVRCVYRIYQGTVTTDSATNITDKSATLYGTVAFNGYDEEYERGFVYGTDPDNLDQWAVESSTASDETAPFNTEITGLTVATKYYYQAYIINDFDTAWGEIKDFNTLQMQVTTDSANNITHYTATLHGTLTHLSYPSVNVGFKYGTSEDALTSIADASSLSTTIPYWADLNGLTEGTTYFFKAFAANGTDTVYGNVKSFTTKDIAVAANAATNVQSAAATLNGELTILKGYEDAKGGFRYGQHKNYMVFFAEKEDAMTATGSYSVDLSNISPNTTYYFQAYAYNGIDTAWAADTLNFATFTVTTDSAKATKNSATLYGSVKSLGSYASAKAGFRYGTSDSTMTNYAEEAEMTAAGIYQFALTGLTPNTTCYFQAYAYNETDTVWAADTLNFATFTVTTDSAKATENSATLYGSVKSLGTYANAKAGFRYGTSTDAMTNRTAETEMTAAGIYQFALTDLTHNTTYYFQVYAYNETDTVWGKVVDFKTVLVNHCPDLYTVTDHEGNMYNTVQIGSQCWLAENMRCATSPKGILQKGENGSSSTTFPWYYDNTAAQFTLRERGLLYNWAGAMDSVFNEQTENEDFTNRRGICPEGWHLPTQDEWNTLATFVSGQDYVCGEHKNGKALASTYGWKTYGDACAVGNGQDGNNATGFSAIASGYYNPDAAFRCVNERAYFWTATSTAEDKAVCHSLAYNVDTLLYSSNSYKYYGQPVRCVCDKPIVCEISFMPNGGMGTMEKQEVIFGEPTTLTANAFNRTAAPEKDRNWEFIGWNTKADGTGDSFANEAEVTFGSDTILYAQWHTWCEGTPKTSVNEFGNSRIDSLKDADDNYYDVVQIGNQCWMKENLRTKTSAYGNVWTNPNADSTIYGRYYDWAAVMQGESTTNYPQSGDKVRGICPEGWHVPSDAEWDTLTYYVKSKAEYKCGGSASNIAKALASAAGWSNSEYACTVGKDQSSNNATGFSAVPAGYLFDGSFRVFGSCTDFWSATQDGVQFAWCRYLTSYVSFVSKSSDTKTICYYSVRCLKD